MTARTFRVTGVAHGSGFARYSLNFTFITNELDQELVWAAARRAARKHIGPFASIAIKSITETQ